MQNQARLRMWMVLYLFTPISPHEMRELISWDDYHFYVYDGSQCM